MSSNEWENVTLGDIAKNIAYGYTASAQMEAVGPKFLRITDIVAGLDWENVPYCKIDYKNISKYKLEVGDIVVARTGATTGTTEIIKDDIDSVFASYLIRFKIDKQKADPFYVGYAVKSILWKDYVKSIIGGSAQPGANAKQFADFEFKLPPLKTQKRISAILTSLDDKIELNRQTNQTFKAISQAIFKDWFVDYNFPGATGEMQDSELGKIPKSWKVYKIEDLVETVSITHKFPKGKAIFLNTSDIDEGKVLHNNYSDKGSLPGQAKKTIKKLDILFTEIRPANKRYALIDFDADDFVVSTKLMVLRSRSNIHPITIYNFLTSDDTLKELQHLAESRSGTFPQITFDQVKALKLVLPESKLLEKYEKTAWSIFNQIKNNEEQTKILTQLRDALLPKLMKGEITAK